MFGYVMANHRELSEADQARFSAFYCGLCRALQADYGLAGRMTLTYDMAFLAVLLTSLYEPETAEAEARCPVHPGKKRAYYSNFVEKYAAAMNFALAYHKMIDNWQDDRNLLAISGAKLLRRRYGRVKGLYPRQCAAIERCMAELAALEKENCRVVDRPAKCFGALLGEIFVMKEDLWADDLRAMGEALGEYIYVLDAYDDLPRDVKKGAYNPLRDMRDRPDAEETCREMLTVLIARCTEAFERLPLVQDLEILRNILYSGVWTRYESIRRRREDGGKEAGQ